jgi:predicted RNA-binding Zn-ribbon protein involved in translation (DUF1610 family)
MNQRFCPHCGEVLVNDGKILMCQVGEMPLSPDIYERLEEAIENRKAANAADLDPEKQGMKCYFCGKQMLLTKSTFSYCCSHCGLIYSGVVVRRLVELHPHLKTDTFKYGYSKNT